MVSLSTAVISAMKSHSLWMGGRVVDCARLESVYTERYRGFESPPIRQRSVYAGIRVFKGLKTVKCDKKCDNVPQFLPVFTDVFLRVF